ncbi:hypothetical protein ACIBXA_19140 [Micromonospora echinaurantiaca]|uniref:hypothetical protein n=1 Tax=Micromonospora echinaurantiaca TaxID=47857 RepID=UPI0037AFB166
MDEREIVGRVGAASPRPGVRRMQDSWLPPSHGWGVLEPRAQRLLADVLLLLNLADRGQDNAERARRLSRASPGRTAPMPHHRSHSAIVSATGRWFLSAA